MHDPKSAKRTIVSIYGSSMTERDDPSNAAGVRIGSRIAGEGADVACGGSGGIMEAVARGGIGTLVEVALTWNLVYMRLIETRPLVRVGAAWQQAVGELRGLLEVSEAHMEHLAMCPDVDAAIGHLKSEGVFS